MQRHVIAGRQTNRQAAGRQTHKRQGGKQADRQASGQAFVHVDGAGEEGGAGGGGRPRRAEQTMSNWISSHEFYDSLIWIEPNQSTSSSARRSAWPLALMIWERIVCWWNILRYNIFHTSCSNAWRIILLVPMKNNIWVAQNLLKDSRLTQGSRFEWTRYLIDIENKTNL